MRRILITGMSGTGKSTLLAELAALGHKTVDTDYDGWSEWTEAGGERDWVWREDRMAELLATEDAEVLFVSGTSVNQGAFYDRFDHVVLLSAPAEVLVDRLATRTTNTYGKGPGELERVLGHLETVEPLLRRGADVEIDASAPLAEVVAAVLRLAGPR